MLDVFSRARLITGRALHRGAESGAVGDNEGAVGLDGDGEGFADEDAGLSVVELHGDLLEGDAGMIGDGGKEEGRHDLVAASHDEGHAQDAAGGEVAGGLDRLWRRGAVGEDLGVGVAQGSGEGEEGGGVALDLHGGIGERSRLLGLVSVVRDGGGDDELGQLHRGVLERGDVGFVEGEILVEGGGGKEGDGARLEFRDEG